MDPTRSLACPFLMSHLPALLLPQYSLGSQGFLMIKSENTRLSPARVVKADIAAGKSIIHVVDQVRGWKWVWRWWAPGPQTMG